jgi:hypothetical protein
MVKVVLTNREEKSLNLSFPNIELASEFLETVGVADNLTDVKLELDGECCLSPDLAYIYN